MRGFGPWLRAAFFPLFGSAMCAPALAQYIAPVHTLRAAINVPVLDAGLQPFRNASYEADVSISDMICHSGIMKLGLEEPPQMKASGWSDLRNGRSGLNLTANTALRFRTEHCLPTGELSVLVTCVAMNSFSGSSVDNVLPIGGRCLALLGALPPVRYSFQLALPRPLPPKDGIDIVLKDPPPSADAEIHLEFGHREKGMWVADGKKKTAYVNAALSGPRQPPDALRLDLGLGKQRERRAVATEQQAVDLMEQDALFDGDWDSLLVGLSLDEHLFGTSDPGEPRTGLFNDIFPVRVFGKLRSGGTQFAFEVFLDGAYVKFENDGITVSLAVSSARVWEPGVEVGTGPGHLVESIRTTLRLGAPAISGQELVYTVQDFRLLLETCVGNVNVKLDSGDISKALNDGGIAVVPVASKLEIALPDCIPLAAGNVEFVSRRACLDGVRKGRIGLVTPVRSVVALLDPSKARFRIAVGKFQIGIPATFSMAP